MKRYACFILFFLIQNVFSGEIFILPTKIGERVFNDILVINEDQTAGAITGSLTVPGVFSAAIIKGRKVVRWAGEFYEFTILANENGEETKIHYNFGYFHDNTNILKGYLMTEDGSKIGVIENAYRLIPEKR